MKLDRTDGTNSIEDLGDRIVFPIVGMCELVSEFVRVQCVGSQSSNTRASIADVRPAAGPQELRIVHTFAFFLTRYGKMVSMDKPRHPQVIRTWKVERIRKPSPPKKALPVKPSKKSKP